MIPVTFRGEPVFLVPFPADFSAKHTLTLGIDSALTRSLGGAEAREAHGHTLRAQLACQLLLRDDEAEVFRAGLRALADKRVLLPLWPAARLLCDGAATAPLLTGIWLTVEPRDPAAFEIHETPAPASPALAQSKTALRAPLMLGHFDKIVEPVALTPRLLAAEIKFTDSAPATFAPRVDKAFSFAAADNGWPLFPFAPNWGDSVASGGAQYDIKRETVGYGRTPATTYYPQRAARYFQAVFTTFSWDDLARLAAFFQGRQGSVEPFVVQHPTDGALGVRFSKPSLEITFQSGRIADTKIGFLELPHETTPPAGETPGVTLGAMPRPAMLYRFTRQYPGQTVVDRFTSYERNVIITGSAGVPPADGGVPAAAQEEFLARLIDSGDIIDSLEPEKTKVKLTSRAFEGNPLMLFSPNRLEVPLIVEVREANPAADGTAPAPRLLFVGRVAKPDIKGPIISAEAAHLLADLQRDVPQKCVQSECNNELFGPSCGVPQADWTFLGEAAAFAGHTLTLANFRRANSAARPAAVAAAGWFAFGRVWFGSGDGFQTRTINDNTAPAAGGAITLTVSQPFDLPPGGTISLIPGCPGTCEACRAFGNYPRFGGFPHVPVGNPSLKAIKDEPKQGKK